MKINQGPIYSYSIAIVVAIIFVSFLLALFEIPIFETYKLLLTGSLGSTTKFGDTLMVGVPVIIASASLVITFKAGLWNIGVEGQIIAGAVAASFVARELQLPTGILLPVMILVGAFGGAFWGLLVGLLKVKGGVNEIFGGLGLNFVATGLVVYLIIGPWSRKGIASTSGTEPFHQNAWFPTLEGFRLSPLAVALSFLVVFIVIYVFSRTQFGLKLRAIGLNTHSSYRFGIPTSKYLLIAFMLGGAVAGLAGVTQVASIHHRLVPSISGGYGYLGILVVLLAGYRPSLVIPIAFFFSMIAIGSIQWQLRLGLHSSLGGVFQGTLVLSVILISAMRLIQQKRNKYSKVGD
ncbi:MAG: ABC transporter permease [Chloroflexota bacterium]|nr:ABC transporter permease [Chloroflexota bacterium]MED5410646.1 ABC transporter permease [Chloroflexota bacterium]MED5450539.1 ABC transporter permease [Chloroflexota bacterium]|tara:strand:- start:7215 stop:8261 length:1047 start_codon:yes stop_codon:yes gene_type:complete